MSNLVSSLNEVHPNLTTQQFAERYNTAYLAADNADRLALNYALLHQWRSNELIAKVSLVFLFDSLDSQVATAYEQEDDELFLKVIKEYETIFGDKWPLVQHILTRHTGSQLHDILECYNQKL